MTSRGGWATAGGYYPGGGSRRNSSASCSARRWRRTAEIARARTASREHAGVVAARGDRGSSRVLDEPSYLSSSFCGSRCGTSDEVRRVDDDPVAFADLEGAAVGVGRGHWS